VTRVSQKEFLVRCSESVLKTQGSKLSEYIDALVRSLHRGLNFPGDSIIWDEVQVRFLDSLSISGSLRLTSGSSFKHSFNFHKDRQLMD
jgi:hypothetical protein